MASKKKLVKVVEKKRYIMAHKCVAGLALVMFGVVIAAGILAEARFITIAYRSFLVFLVIMLGSRVLIRAWASFEEIHSG